MDIKNILQELFRDILDIENLVLENKTSANEIEEWDSLAHINLIVAIEREFNIKFALGELQDLKNIGNIMNLISIKIKK
ncbi:putative acyl carrier protein [Psychromonas ingrahamii 37]|uniref:Putative acyl carrier protein n=1 Tax=Psychromonas ingrahamii (strain DSM 17664 / CCUG 51855 / 37) TaxID=357804 RepID=A1SVB4_PSYIN|nr:acyl carrier protein [Psychromonas ingrahamii]ABM03429.1 putative acyl carrier protein [Psychromonas ingrahamii 37]